MVISAVIVAAGSGARMGSQIPKQFIELNDRAILIETICRFLSYPAITSIVVVLPSCDFDHWASVVKAQVLSPNLFLVKGGETRTESVFNGLCHLKEGAGEQDVVLIHDGVRPFVSDELIARVVTQTVISGGVVPAVKVVDTVRKVEGDSSVTIDRTPLRAVQTPQGFLFSTIYKGYSKAMSNTSVQFTDDASVYEWLGEKVAIVEGDYLNIKITTPTDLILGRAILGANN